MTCPDRRNAVNRGMPVELVRIWTASRHDRELAMHTGAGCGFWAGEEMKDSPAKKTPAGAAPRWRTP